MTKLKGEGGSSRKAAEQISKPHTQDMAYFEKLRGLNVDKYDELG